MSENVLQEIMETTIVPLPTSLAPSTSTFSFKAPFPASSSSSSAHGAVTASALKHRRVSLASQSSPRVVQAWSFRDDTGLDSQAASSSTNGQLVPEKKGKMRKIDLSQVGDDSARLEKKPRKKWTEEETKMLVEGCQTVSNLQYRSLPTRISNYVYNIARRRQLEDNLARP
jgi:hypothetical protein